LHGQARKTSRLETRVVFDVSRDEVICTWVQWMLLWVQWMLFKITEIYKQVSGN